MAEGRPDRRRTHVPNERHAVLVSLRELLSASVTWWFSWGALVPTLVAVGLYVLLRVVPNAASTARRDSLGISIVVGVVLSLLANFHRVRQERDVSRLRPVDDEHRDRLRDLLRGAQNQVQNKIPCGFGDPALPRPQPQRMMAAAHFPEVVAIADQWNDVVRRNAAGPTPFEERVSAAVRDADVFPPSDYALGTLRQVVTKLVAESDEFDMTFSDDGLWDYTYRDAVGLLFLRSAPNSAQRSSIAMFDATSAEDAGERANVLAEPVNELLVSALVWPETQEMKAARSAFDGFDATVMWDTAQSELIRSQIFPSPHCENCRATHGLAEPHERSRGPMPRHLIVAYHEECAREDERRDRRYDGHDA